MMKCPDCGKEVDEVSDYCPSCGAKLSKVDKYVEIEKKGLSWKYRYKIGLIFVIFGILLYNFSWWISNTLKFYVNLEQQKYTGFVAPYSHIQHVSGALDLIAFLSFVAGTIVFAYYGYRYAKS